MKKFPKNTMIVDVEALGGEITLSELTQAHKIECNQNDAYDTPTNALINAGLSEQQIGLLGERVLIALFEEVLDLTYPNARSELQEQIESGKYVAATNEEKEESKKKQ